MHHPETLLLTPLMAADYLLTRIGARRGARSRVVCSRSGAPALPLWRRTVARSRWPLAHLAYLVVIGIAFTVACRDVDADDPLLAALIGFFAGLYGTLIGLNVAALSMQRVATARRRDITGTLTIDDETTIALSNVLVAIALAPLGFVTLLSPTPTTLGAAAGAFALVIVHRLWLANARRVGERSAIRLDAATSRAAAQTAS